MVRGIDNTTTYAQDHSSQFLSMMLEIPGFSDLVEEYASRTVARYCKDQGVINPSSIRIEPHGVPHFSANIYLGGILAAVMYVDLVIYRGNPSVVVAVKDIEEM